MTQNQIAYQNYLESVKHNRASEGETLRHNVAGESETNRHNVVSEQQQSQSLTEINRHNVATEKEAKRSAKATVAETHRANTLNYKAQLRKIKNDLKIAKASNASKEKIAQLQAEVNKYTSLLNAQTSARNADVAAAASKYAADASAGASKYGALMNYNASQFRTLMDKAIADDKNATSVQMNNAQIKSTEAIKLAERMQNAVKMRDQRAVNKARYQIDMYKADIDKAYKQKEITLQEYQMLFNWITGQERLALDGVNSITNAAKAAAPFKGGTK